MIRVAGHGRNRDGLAEIRLQQTDLAVIWSPNEAPRPCVFPYGLSRADVEAALRLGP